jgi:hypothetical protein
VRFEKGNPQMETPIPFGRNDFKFVWKGAAAGTYSITAIATDTFGISSNPSAPVDVTVK